MARRGARGGPSGGHGDDDGDEGERERERRREDEREERAPWDDPEEHHRIEKHRFVGSLPATPERYALAREQWQRLPGAVVRPSMVPPAGAPPAQNESEPPAQAQPGGKESEP